MSVFTKITRNEPFRILRGRTVPKGRRVLRKEVKDERNRPGLQKRSGMHLSGFREGKVSERPRIVVQGSKR